VSSAPLRVAHVISGLESGGAEGFLARLAPALDGRVESTVISLRTEGVHGAGLRSAGIAVEAVGLERGSFAPRSLPRLVRLLRGARPDVVQTWLYHGDLLGGLAGRALGRPVAWNLRQQLGHGAPATHGRLIGTCARLSRSIPSAIVAVSAQAAEDHVRVGYAADKVRVIPNGFDLGRFHPDPGARASVRQELGLAPDALLIGLVARHDPQKDHATALRAVAALRARRPDVHLVLVGKGVDDDAGLRAEIAASGVGAGVHLLGERADLPRLQSAWDVALSSSITEGLSNAIGEAMACGVPAVVTSGGATAELVGETGATPPSGRPDELAAALGRILDLGADERAELGGRARDRVASGYSLDRAVEAYADLYAELVRR
jgi:glycosyltransferase involved in cell wall biosynthesis